MDDTLDITAGVITDVITEVVVSAMFLLLCGKWLLSVGVAVVLKKRLNYIVSS